MKVAALDLGSNTFLCLICEVDFKAEREIGPKEPVIQQVYADEVEVVRLGQGLQVNKKFHPDALARADVCLQKFKKIIDQYQPEKILAMATAAAREAENKEQLFEICNKHGIPLEIIPGEKEAQITYTGATSAAQSNKKRLVLDIGGGSTEYILGESLNILFAQSFPIGCVKLTEKFILSQPTSNNEVEACRAEIQKTLAHLSIAQVDEVLAVAGTPTTLAAVEIGGLFDPKKIDGYRMTLSHLQSWLQKLKPLSVIEKQSLGFPQGRADVILVGVLILIETLKKFQLNELIVSTRGVRYGIALEIARRTL